MASDRLRYGVIGTGMMGIEHLKNLALVPGAEVVAFADPHAESRRRSPRKVESFPVPVEQRLLAAGFHHGATYTEHERFFAAATRGAPVEVTAEDGLRAVEIGLAAEQSVRSARPIALRGAA